MPEQITISVDSDLAHFYRAATNSDRRKLELLLNLRLRDAVKPRRTLQEIMDEISCQAQQRGLTPEILQSLLDEE